MTISGSPIWHPFTQHAVQPDATLIASGEGAWLTTAGGRRIMGKGQAWLRENGAECLRWEIDGQAVTGPAPWTGWPLMEGFRQRSELLDVEAAKLGFILRRAVMVANGRTAARYPLPRDRGWSGVCHTFQPHVREFAERIEGLRRDYSHSSESMLAHVHMTPGYDAI